MVSKKTVGVVGGAALLVALGSTGTAVAGGMITSAQISKNAVTGDKVKDGTLTLKDFKSSERSKLQGPAGPAGPVGPMGAVGPAGVNALNNPTIVQSPAVTVAAGDISSVSAFCPAGKKVSGGGYFSSIAVAASSSPSLSGTSWGAVINNSDNIISVDVWAYAVCS